MEFVKTSTVELIKHNGNDEDVARAAWVSNFGFDARLKDKKGIKGLVKFLYREKHLSPFEHGSFTFFIDTHMAVAREFMRHRTFSYNEVSGRYKELEPRFYVPDSIRPIIQTGKIGSYTFEQGNIDQIYLTQNAIMDNSVDCWDHYQYIKAQGVANEVARLTLPMNTMTQFYATANPRNVLQFLLLRNELQALYEIREVADQIEQQFAAAMPMTYEAFVEQREVQDVVSKLVDKYGIEKLQKMLLEDAA